MIMAKSIKIPDDRGSRITVWINGVEYVYAAGATVTVPDEVAAAIADMLAMDPSGVRETALEEAMEGYTGEIGNINAELGQVAADVEELKNKGGVTVLTVIYNSTTTSYVLEDETITGASFYEMITGKAVMLKYNTVYYTIGYISAGDDDYDALFYSVNADTDTDENTARYLLTSGDIEGTAAPTITRVNYTLTVAE
jgi:hypothetical protein